MFEALGSNGKICQIVAVGSQFAAQAQNVWDIGPVSPVQ